MSSSTLQLTQFKIQKLRCIGGQGRATPYRITTYRGMELGTVGQVMDSTEDAINSSICKLAEAGKLNRFAGQLLRTMGLATAG